jgi:hypothetical protein
MSVQINPKTHLDSILDILVPTNPIRKSSRIRQKPSYLQIFHCQMTTLSLSRQSITPSDSCIPYAFPYVLSHDELSFLINTISFWFQHMLNQNITIKLFSMHVGVKQCRLKSRHLKIIIHGLLCLYLQTKLI